LPELVEAEQVTHFFKYDSGNKAFKEIAGIRQFSTTTDACVIARAKRTSTGK
jgi:hypothetical protein